ncbi:hypothetical protein RZE82_08795 [Mollicutes bacterium LVI A0039]|nr:hypothetical protein RZE82_08795 [Mollicutes bacterium LVI A0039]
MPEEFKLFCEWVNNNGYPISGYFELEPDDGKYITHWFGFDDVNDRFGVFGADGSGALYAFWIDDEGKQKIVHLGSEGDNLYIIADDFIKFLQLLAIGYNELAYAELSLTIAEWNKAIDAKVGEGVNPKFQEWVESTFSVKESNRGSEIADFSDSSFEEWVEQQLENNRENN